MFTSSICVYKQYLCLQVVSVFTSSISVYRGGVLTHSLTLISWMVRSVGLFQTNPLVLETHPDVLTGLYSHFHTSTCLYTHSHTSL